MKARQPADGESGARVSHLAKKWSIFSVVAQCLFRDLLQDCPVGMDGNPA
jgi:hypothetical protein